jgi:hypothetical protein
MEKHDWVDGNPFGLESFVCREMRGLEVCHGRTTHDPSRVAPAGIMDPKEGGQQPTLALLA